jgi:hypothetical protein
MLQHDFFLPSINDTFPVALPWMVDFGGCVKNYLICYNGHSLKSRKVIVKRREKNYK